MNNEHSAVRWHCLDPQSAVERLDSNRSQGLSQKDAEQRLVANGPNEIALHEERSLLRIAAAQLSDLMIVVLLAAALVAAALGETQDSIVIIVIVLLNALVGASQEIRAQRAIAALRDISALEARVVRDGAEQTIYAVDLTPGDIVRIAAGDIVPADMRLLDANGLSIDESALTGESLAVSKQSDLLADESLALGDRNNLAFKSTAVTKGRAIGIVVATGPATEIGRIAHLLAAEKVYGTPLQIRLAAFGRRLALAVLAICALIFALGLLQGQAPLLMFLTAVSLAVAAIPEALPAVVTASLALGARRLSRQHCLVRRLPAVETLGSITYICADKTGTLTENRMRLAAIRSASTTSDDLRELSESLRQPLGTALALCSELEEGQAQTDDPTEVALREAAVAAGFEPRTLGNEFPEVCRFAFDSERKRMTTVRRTDRGFMAYCKGAPEEVLARCDHALGPDGQFVPIDQPRALEETTQLARSGHRVLAVAMRPIEGDSLVPATTGEDPQSPGELEPDSVETAFVLLALIGLSDPVRAEVPAAIRDCVSAGIAPIMITGDHPETARHIGERLGLIEPDGNVLTGRALADGTQEELAASLRNTRIYARIDPEQKIRIVNALQASGEFVAMTGDGVNDAPALKQASIGVAMGQRGTNVAREAADMVLLDDNFATIVMAIREGRRVFDNIRKFIKYTLTSNAGEIWVLLLAPLIGLPIPLLPIQILWINLVTDGLPGLAFAAEPAERDIMQRPPRPPRESIFAHGLWQYIAAIGLVIGGLSLATAFWAETHDGAYWQTMVFTTLVTAQLAQALAVRSEVDSLLSIGLFSNRFMVGAVALTLAAQILVIYTPAFNALLKTMPLSLADLAICLGLGVVVLPLVELLKWFTARPRR